jgi:hypothetical protein
MELANNDHFYLADIDVLLGALILPVLRSLLKTLLQFKFDVIRGHSNDM